ncbi:hypothetical protein VTL71DRAFT_1322 [Oculimacula yallundae]|uniref:BTB domain-containing protein n=1 Tax=Oculimacula yallundae TaxID=86028 RepID=A0ABR4CAC7_9HELO
MASTSSQRKRPLEVEDQNLIVPEMPQVSRPVSRPAALPSIYDPQPVVTISVAKHHSSKTNPEAITFYIHKNFICHHSPFFKAAFNGEFTEGQTQHMNLLDIEEYVFAIFTNWIYTQKLQNKLGKDIRHFGCLFKLWSVAERFIMPELQNQVIHILHHMVRDIQAYITYLTFSADVRSHGSPISMKLLLDKLAVMDNESMFRNLSLSLDPEELLELARLMKANQVAGRTSMRPVEEYLVAVEGEKGGEK